jgi:uncharacterized membrane protein YgcG
MKVLDGQALFIIGITGCIFFAIASLLGVYCAYHAINKYTKRIFIFITLSMLCELPRYGEFIRTHRYTGISVYCLHLLGNLFYFASLSSLCFAWGDALRAKNLEEFFEMKRRSRMRLIIIIANIIFFLHTIVVIYRCATSSTLNSFFSLPIFISYTLTDTIKNLIMGIFITRFGYNLYQKVQNYSAFYSRASPVDQTVAKVELTRHLLTAAEKLKYLVLILNFCFIIRGIALVLWFTSGNDSTTTENESPKSFPGKSASAYWLFFETFPAMVPLFALAFTMGSPAKIWGGVFIDTNKTQQQQQQQGRATSESAASDLSNSDNIAGGGEGGGGGGRTAAAMKALNNPLLLSGHSHYDDDDSQLFNRLSRISGELIDVDMFDPSMMGRSGTESSSWKEYSGAGSSNNRSSNPHEG